MRWPLALLFLYGLLLGAGSLIDLGDSAVGRHDKLMHFLAYAGFALLAYPAARSARGFALFCAAIIGYGLALEGLQALTATRTMSAADGLADAVGVGMVFGVIYFLRFRRKRRRGAMEVGRESDNGTKPSPDSSD